MEIKKIVLLLFLCLSLTMIAQNNTYTDYVKDENGIPQQGITVRVRGSNSSDITNEIGEFTVTARKGDVIQLYKNNQKIGSYVYNGSLEYRIDNRQKDLYSKKDSIGNQYKQAMDSAYFNLDKRPLKTISFIEKALQHTKKKKKIAKAYHLLGDANYKLKQYDLAKDDYLLAYENSKKSNAIALQLVKTFLKLNNLTNASLYLNKVLNSKNKTKKQEIESFILEASILEKNNKNSNAIQKLNKALLLSKEHNYTNKSIKINEKLAKLYAKKGNMVLSKTYFNNSVNSAKRKSKNEELKQNNKAADFFGETEDYDEEIKLRKENLKTIKSISKPMELGGNISIPKIKKDIGKALIKKQDYNQAIKYFKESELDASKVNDIETQKEAVQGLTEAYVALGDDKNALKNYKKYTKLVDLLYKEKESEIKRAIIVGKSLAEKQNRILSLEKDRKLNENKLQLIKTEKQLIKESSKRQKTVIYSLSIGLLLLLFALYYLFKSNKERKKANNLLALKQLRTQMNPHFIFNALNSVNGFIANNDERSANKYLTDFSKLMRSVLNNSEKDFIPLATELELLEIYLKLEHTRFKDKFDYKITIDSNIKIEKFTIPPMLLQPYVENAVWHGLRYKKEKGLLTINVKYIDDYTINIEITDNGIGRKKSKELKSKNQLKHQSKGMQNIKNRIEILNEMHPKKIIIKVIDLEQESGTKIVLSLSCSN